MPPPVQKPLVRIIKNTQITSSCTQTCTVIWVSTVSKDLEVITSL